MKNKLPGIIILFLVASIGGYYLWQFGIYAASTFTADRPSFQADLKSTLDLQAGVGKPTFTRATTATVTDFEGLIKNVKSGEARFEGARRVENLVTNSENYSSNTASSNVSGSTSSGNTVTFSGANGYNYRITSSFPSGRVLRLSGKVVSGTIASVGFRLSEHTSGASSFVSINTATDIGKRFSVIITTTGAGAGTVDYGFDARSGFGGSGVSTGDITLTNFQIEDVTGQANQNPSEYISTNVKTSTPYHGANVDGVKYFTTYNGNTVASNVVTEATGASIPDVTLHGYVAEGARTNLVKQSNAFTTLWVSQFITVTQDQTGMDGSATTAWTLTDSDGSNANILQSVSLTASTQYAYSLYVKKTVGAQSSYPVMSVAYFPATAERALATIDTTNGVATVWTSYTGATIMTSSASCLSANADFWRCTLNFTPLTTVAHSIYFLPTGASTNNKSTGTFDSDMTGSVVIWGAQLEAGAFASSYIPTTTASVTRNADVLTYPTANVDRTKGSSYAEYMVPITGGVYRAVLHLGVSAGPITLHFTGFPYIWDGTTQTDGPSISITGSHKAGSYWSNSGKKAFGDGLSGTLGSFDGTLETNGNFYIGIDQWSSAPLYGTIKNVRIWKKALTDTQLTNMTSTNTSVSQSAVKKTTVGADGSSFQADLKNTLDLQAGVGVPTFTRATTATVTDFEGLIKNVKSGEARFEGARRVENLLTYSEDFSNAVWTKLLGSSVSENYDVAPNGTITADRLIYDGTANSQVGQIINSTVAGHVYKVSVYVKSDGTSQQQKTLYMNGTLVVFTPTTVWKRIVLTRTATASNEKPLLIGNSGAGNNSFLAWGMQTEDVTGQANQNPSEYISTNVKTSTPYHGANVDGVKYFTTYNGNTVASNVVTEATGASIPDATLHGYTAEGARTNLALQSETFDNASWTNGGGITVTPNVITAPSGSMTADNLNTTGVAGRISQNITVSGNTVYTVSAYLKKNTSSVALVQATSLGGANPALSCYAAVNLDTQTISTANSDCTFLSQNLVSAGNGWYHVTFSFQTSSTHNNIQLFLYGGSWYATPGQTYWWGAQLEAGAFASSYIPTTTASVTRNADVLTYQTSGNVDGTKGSAYAEATVNVIDTASNQGVIDIAGAGNRPLFTRKSSDNKLAYYDGTNDISTGLTWNDTLKKKIALTWGGTTAKAFMNGTADTARAFDGDFNASIIQIGRQVSSGYLFGTIRNVKIWKKALTDTQLTNMTSTNTAVAQSAVRKKTIKVTQSDKFTNGLVGIWSFNGPDMSGNTAIDRSGMGNNGTTTGGVRVVLGKNGQGIQLNGTSGYVSVVSAGVSGGNPRSISLWVKPASISLGIKAMVAYGTASSRQQFGLYKSVVTPGEIYFSSNGRDYRTAQANLSVGAWSHVVVTYNGGLIETSGSIKIYVDGANKTLASVGVATGVLNTSNAELRIGNDAFAAGREFDGKIDEVRIYNRALSANEVTQLYNLGR